MTEIAFDEREVWRSIASADAKTKNGRKALRGIARRIGRFKSPETEVIIGKMESKIENKLELNLGRSIV